MYTQTEIKKSLSLIKPSDIDDIIDRYSLLALSGDIKNSENFLKVCLLSQGKTNNLKGLAIKSGADGIHCGNPSFDVEEYTKMSMEKLMRE